MSENYFNDNARLHKQAVKALEVAKDVNKNRKVKKLPNGFSYEIEKLRNKVKNNEQYKSNYSTFSSY